MHGKNPLEKRLYRRNRVWSFWAWDYRGKRYAATTHQTERRAALDFARAEERRRAIPPDPAAANPEALALTLGRAVELLRAEDIRNGNAPRTLNIHATRGRHLVRLLGRDRRLAPSEFGIADSNAYVDQRLTEGPGTIKQRHTIAQEIGTLIQCLHVAKDAGLYDGSPSTLRPKAFRKKKRYYRPGEGWLSSAAQCDALVAEISTSHPRNKRSRIDRRLHVIAYIHLGVRRNELYLIKPEDVRLADGYVLVDGRKTDGARRMVALSATMRAVFERLLKGARRGQQLFAPWPGVNRDLKTAWQRVRARLEHEVVGDGATEPLPASISPNDLRRTFCSLMAAAGVPAHHCADLLGHESVTMVMQVYRRVAPASLHGAVAKLPSLALPAIPIDEGTVTVRVGAELRETVSAAHDNRRKSAAKPGKNRKSTVTRG